MAGDLSKFSLYFTSVTRPNAHCTTAACNALPAGAPGEDRLAKYIADNLPPAVFGDFAPEEAGLIDEDTWYQQVVDLNQAYDRRGLQVRPRNAPAGHRRPAGRHRPDRRGQPPDPGPADPDRPRRVAQPVLRPGGRHRAARPSRRATYGVPPGRLPLGGRPPGPGAVVDRTRPGRPGQQRPRLRPAVARHRRGAAARAARAAGRRTDGQLPPGRNQRARRHHRQGVRGRRDRADLPQPQGARSGRRARPEPVPVHGRRDRARLPEPEGPDDGSADHREGADQGADGRRRRQRLAEPDTHRRRGRRGEGRRTSSTRRPSERWSRRPVSSASTATCRTTSTSRHNINMHATFVAAGPDIRHQHAVRHVRAVDLAPTLAVLGGFDPPLQAQGSRPDPDPARRRQVHDRPGARVQRRPRQHHRHRAELHRPLHRRTQPGRRHRHPGHVPEPGPRHRPPHGDGRGRRHGRRQSA